jgi:hypothetical protein
MRAGPFRGFSLWVFSLCSLCLCGSFSYAGLPRLARVTPPGGSRGTTVEVEFSGRHLEQPKDVLFYEPGIKAEAVEMLETAVGPNGGKPLRVEPGTRVRVRLKIDADCPLGPHGVRLVTADGLTEYHRFFVGPFPTVEEAEVPQKQRNDKRETAKDVPANSTVIGRLNEPSDVDMYRIEVKRGQRVSAEIEAARIGVERGIPDLHLAVYDPDGKKLASADDSALFVQDPVVSVLAPRDGPHYVEVRHSMYNGSADPYRLHVGTFSRPTAVYPAGGPAGESLHVRLLGDPAGVREQDVPLPATPGDFAFVARDRDGVTAPSPNTLRVSPFPNVLETEPNDTPEVTAPAAVASLPVAFNGVIDKPGDVDCFRFRAKKGERFTFFALANALGTAVDPVIWVRPVNTKSNAVQRSGTARPNQLGYAPAGGLTREANDAVLEFTAPADGEYVLGVEDERGEGGADYVYRVEARPETNGVYAYIAPEPENQFQPQLRQSISVAPGNRSTVQVGVFTTARPISGEMELVGVNLPEGVTLHAPKLTPGMTRVPVVFEAAATAKPGAALIDLAVRPVGGKPGPDTGYRQTIAMNAYGNNDYYLHVPIDRLALAVTDPAPFRVEVEEPKSALVQNGEMTVKFRVHRAAGYTGPVTVQMEWKPNGISTATPFTVKAGETEGTYLLGAARNASAGKHQVTLTAMSGGSRRGYGDGEGRTYIASAPFFVTVAEPHVEAKLPRTSVERGKTATLVCKLTHLQRFEGKAKATLARLPRGVELVEPMREITSADKEVSFTIRATNEALVGSYQGVVMDLTVTENGQAIRQLSGSGIVRVDAERGTKTAGK